jgi:hypothetical protein
MRAMSLGVPPINVHWSNPVAPVQAPGHSSQAPGSGVAPGPVVWWTQVAQAQAPGPVAQEQGSRLRKPSSL